MKKPIVFNITSVQAIDPESGARLRVKFTVEETWLWDVHIPLRKGKNRSLSSIRSCSGFSPSLQLAKAAARRALKLESLWFSA